MPKKKSAKKKSGNRKPAGRKNTIRRKKPILRKKPTRSMKSLETTSAQIHQGVAPEAQPEPTRQSPGDDAEYGGES
jgi:hypothetical protein